MELLVSYTIEEVVNNSGAINLGITRIPDFMLLEEMVNYRAKPKATNGIHDGNFDRIVAAYHALILAEHLDKYMPLAYQTKEKKEEVVKKPPVIKGFFGDLTPKKTSLNSINEKRRGFNFI